MQHQKGQVQAVSAYCRYYLGIMYWYYVYSEFGTSLTGILAGIWLCGIVTLLDEVFVVESISQVYGIVHSLLHPNPPKTSEISEYLI